MSILEHLPADWRNKCLIDPVTNCCANKTKGFVDQFKAVTARYNNPDLVREDLTDLGKLIKQSTIHMITNVVMYALFWTSLVLLTPIAYTILISTQNRVMLCISATIYTIAAIFSAGILMLQFGTIKELYQLARDKDSSTQKPSSSQPPQVLQRVYGILPRGYKRFLKCYNLTQILFLLIPCIYSTLFLCLRSCSVTSIVIYKIFNKSWALSAYYALNILMSHITSVYSLYSRVTSLRILLTIGSYLLPVIMLFIPLLFWTTLGLLYVITAPNRSIKPVIEGINGAVPPGSMFKPVVNTVRERLESNFLSSPP